MAEMYPYPRFSLAERDRRWRAVRELMARQGIDVIVAPNNSGNSTDFQADSRYLTHCGGGGDADVAAVFPLEGEVTAIATSAKLRWLAVQEWTRDVREANRRYGKVIVERLKELELVNRRIGITGLGDVDGTRTPEGTILYRVWKQVREAFPDAELVDATPILNQVRYVKSQEEIDALSKSMAIIELAYEAEAEAARPGVRDWDVWAATMYALMRNGSEFPVHYNWVSGKNPPRTLTRPSLRILERGDIIMNDLEASWIGYRAQGVQPVFVQEVDAVYRELINVQREVFNRVCAGMKPGITAGELGKITERAGKKAAPKSGPATGASAALTMHGRGAGDDGPIVIHSTSTPRQLDVELLENMVFICKPSVTTADRAYRLTWGDTVVVTGRGARRLGKRAHEIVIA
jgi:Xaa-Pro dipeptidase